MLHINKHWIAAGFLGLGTLSFGIVVILMGFLVGQKGPITESSTQAASPQCTLTFSITLPTSTPTPGSSDAPTMTPEPSGSPSPIPGGQCVNVKIYRVNEGSWTVISDLSTVTRGETVFFAVAGAASGGIIDSARFLINNGAWMVTTLVNPFGEYYIEYAIPNIMADLLIQAQVHHSMLGWL